MLAHVWQNNCCNTWLLKATVPIAWSTEQGSCYAPQDKQSPSLSTFFANLAIGCRAAPSQMQGSRTGHTAVQLLPSPSQSDRAGVGPNVEPADRRRWVCDLLRRYPRVIADAHGAAAALQRKCRRCCPQWPNASGQRFPSSPQADRNAWLCSRRMSAVTAAASYAFTPSATCCAACCNFRLSAQRGVASCQWPFRWPAASRTRTIDAPPLEHLA